jgi:hypothetical protein
MLEKILAGNDKSWLAQAYPEILFGEECGLQESKEPSPIY